MGDAGKVVRERICLVRPPPGGRIRTHPLQLASRAALEPKLARVPKQPQGDHNTGNAFQTFDQSAPPPFCQGQTAVSKICTKPNGLRILEACGNKPIPHPRLVHE
eukprot:15152572-Alexandrium_andersonii.AAC.1